MPWTFAHPAAVLPLLRLSGPGKLSFAALAVGSMSPDFGYYLGLFALAGMAHSPLGVLALCVPSGLLVLLLMDLLREPIADLLPQPHRQAVLAASVPPALFKSSRLAFAVVSLVIGATTHLAWDAFTHDGRFFVQHIDALRAPLFTAFQREFRVFNLLQHGSTLMGCALLGLAYYRHARRFGSFFPASRDEGRRYALLAGILISAALFALPFALADARGAEPALFSSMLLVRQLIYTTTAFFALLILTAAWRRIRRTR